MYLPCNEGRLWKKIKFFTRCGQCVYHVVPQSVLRQNLLRKKSISNNIEMRLIQIFIQYFIVILQLRNTTLFWLVNLWSNKFLVCWVPVLTKPVNSLGFCPTRNPWWGRLMKWRRRSNSRWRRYDLNYFHFLFCATNSILQTKLNNFFYSQVLCLSVAVGHVEMTPDELVQNVHLSINFLVSLLKKHWQNVRSLHIKSSMGAPQRLY